MSKPCIFLKAFVLHARDFRGCSAIPIPPLVLIHQSCKGQEIVMVLLSQSCQLGYIVRALCHRQLLQHRPQLAWRHDQATVRMLLFQTLEEGSAMTRKVEVPAIFQGKTFCLATTSSFCCLCHSASTCKDLPNDVGLLLLLLNVATT